MALHKFGRQMNHARSTGAGNAIAIDHVLAVCGHCEARKGRCKFLTVKPADAGQVAVQQPRPSKQKGARAHTDQGDPDLSRLMQEGQCTSAQSLAAMQETAHHHNVVKGLR